LTRWLYTQASRQHLGSVTAVFAASSQPGQRAKPAGLVAARIYQDITDNGPEIGSIPVPQVKALYTSVIAQLTLLSLAAIVNCDSERHIDAVVFNGVVGAVDPRSGQPIRPCLIAVRVTRDAFAEINLQDVDPSACLKRLSATVSGNPTGFVSVRPLA
jgi:restriction system protein